MPQQPARSSFGSSVLLAAVGAALGLISGLFVWGILGGALLGLLLGQLLYLHREVSRLSRAVDWLEARDSPKQESVAARIKVEDEFRQSRSAAAAKKATQVGATDASNKRPVELGESAPHGSIPSSTERPEPIGKNEARSASKAPAAKAPRAELMQQAFDWVRGGNPLARIGIVILFFGASFLAKYSAEHGLFPIEARMMALAAGAVGFVGLGWWLRQKNGVFAQILQGGGIAGFYLTVFASLRVFDLMPAGLAFGLMVTVVAASALLAVLQNARTLAFLATAGGFLAPLLVSTGSGSHVALFSYYLILNLGVLAVAFAKAWRELNLAAFVFTFGISTAFRVLEYDATEWLSIDGFLILYFLLFVGISVLFALRQKPDLKGYVSGSLVFGLPIVVFGLHASLVSQFEYALSWSALAFGLFYAGLAWLLLRRGPDTTRLLAEAFAALAVIFGSLAIPLAFDAKTTATMWAVEGAGLLWLGVRQRRVLARLFGLLLQLAAGAAYLGRYDDIELSRSIINGGFFGTLMLSLVGYFSAWCLHQARSELRKFELAAPMVLGGWALAWWGFGGLLEIDRYVGSSIDMGVGLMFGAGTVLLLCRVSAKLEWANLMDHAALVAGLSLFLGLLGAIDRHPLVELGYIAWPVWFAAVAYLLWSLEQRKIRWSFPELTRAHAVFALLIGLIFTIELHWQIDRLTQGVWCDLVWGLVPAMLLWKFNRPWPVWPYTIHPDAFRVMASVPLAALGLIWALVINLSSNGDAAGIPYLPLLNPLDISVALVMLLSVNWWRQLDDASRASLSRVDSSHVWMTIASIGFVWLTAALLRSLHHLASVPWASGPMMNSFLVQSSLSVFWGILGILTIVMAARFSKRDIWIVGAGLMAVVVIKLFLVDLSGTNRLARIVSFLTVGGLLLLAGYLAPLPPANRPSVSNRDEAVSP